jgi:8-oxo-dGTP pyrophosphatase MutT (NUDIX family)
VVFRRAGDGTAVYLLIRDSYENWGFPKGHIERGEPPVAAARREVTEETGLGELVERGAIDVIDWYFRFGGRTIHKFCHFFLFEAPSGDPVPQREEGITACVWHPIAAALDTISYANARRVLQGADELVRGLAPTSVAPEP